MTNQSLFVIDEFVLPVVYPVRFIEELGISSNRPVLVTAKSSVDGEKGDYVVKLVDGERMNADAFQRECLASLLGSAVGLHTPEPARVEVTDEFIESRTGFKDYQRFKNSRGANFGTKYVAPLHLFGHHTGSRLDLREEALKVFTFDLVIQNSDRTTVNGKSNLFTDDENLIILDHEMAFTFLFPILGRPQMQPWEFGSFDLSWVRSHVLYPYLHGKNLNFNVLQDFLAPLTQHFWHEIRRIIPDEWRNESDLRRTEEHVSAIRDHQEEFIRQIQILLQ